MRQPRATTLFALAVGAACTRFGTTDVGPGKDAGTETTADADAMGREDGATASGYPALVLADGPVAYFRLGERASTPIVRSLVPPFQGTVSGAAALGVEGLIGGDPDTAVRLGATGSIDLGPDVFTGVGPFTLEAWVSVESNGTYRMIFNKEFDDDAGKQTDLANVVVQDGTITFERYVQKNFVHVDTPTPITFYVPHHVVATYDGDSIALYVDGASMGSPQQQLAQPARIAQPLVIGSPRPDLGASFVGVIDEVAIYATALTVPRISAHFVAGRR